MIGFGFDETMDGAVIFDGERFDRLVNFTLSMTGRHIHHLATTAELAAVGIIHIDGFAESAPVVGAFTMSPFTKRHVVYRLEFTSDEGAPCSFEGHKYIDYRRPFQTWTTLHVTLANDTGNQIAEGTMRFRLRDDLKELAASFGPRRIGSTV